MNDHTELEGLRARVADLENRLAAHESMRSGAVDALAGVSVRLARMQDYIAAQPHPVAVARQQAGTLEHYAVLATRTRALEEGFDELRGVVVELFTAVREYATEVERVREMLERFNRRIDGGPLS